MPVEYPSSLELIDLLYSPICIFIIYIIAFIIRNRNISEYPYYKYFVQGLSVKLFGAVGMCFVYLYYYQGGDTVNYFFSAKVMLELLTTHPWAFNQILFFGQAGPEYYSYFSFHTGYPLYFNDPLSFFIVRIATPFVLITGKSYLAASILFTCISYTGIWKLYTVFVEEFPEIPGRLAIGVLFIPSVFFWGSGILKDSITISAAGWFTFAIYQIVSKKRYQPKFFFYLIFSSYILLSVKPYIFYVFLPSSSALLLYNSLARIKSGMMRFLSFPLMLAIFSTGTFLLLLQLGQDKAKFTFGQILQTAVVTQQDLKKEVYGGATFDLGEFDASIGSMLSKFPIAVNAALFRPYIWEAKNPLMMFSAIEIMLIFFLTVYLLIQIRFTNIIKFIRQRGILFFSISFVLMFAFAVGISTPNFGSLVRYKIPCIPFYVATILILLNENSKFEKGILMNTPENQEA